MSNDEDVKKLKKEFGEHIRDHDRLATVLASEISTKVQLDAKAALDHVTRVVAPVRDELRVLREKTDAQSADIEATRKETEKQTPMLQAWAKGKKRDRKERRDRKAQDVLFRRWIKRFLWLLGIGVTVWEAARSFGLVK